MDYSSDKPIRVHSDDYAEFQESIDLMLGNLDDKECLMHSLEELKLQLEEIKLLNETGVALMPYTGQKGRLNVVVEIDGKVFDKREAILGTKKSSEGERAVAEKP